MEGDLTAQLEIELKSLQEELKTKMKLKLKKEMNERIADYQEELHRYNHIFLNQIWFGLCCVCRDF